MAPLKSKISKLNCLDRSESAANVYLSFIGIIRDNEIDLHRKFYGEFSVCLNAANREKQESIFICLHWSGLLATLQLMWTCSLCPQN